MAIFLGLVQEKCRAFGIHRLDDHFGEHLVYACSSILPCYGCCLVRSAVLGPEVVVGEVNLALGHVYTRNAPMSRAFEHRRHFRKGLIFLLKHGGVTVRPHVNVS